METWRRGDAENRSSTQNFAHPKRMKCDQFCWCCRRSQYIISASAIAQLSSFSITNQPSCKICDRTYLTQAANSIISYEWNRHPACNHTKPYKQQTTNNK
ncbi:MAG: hypothetical protein F6K41_43360 [Symploca sp. SIO3E6]|nr:hypothetical protein [Caldora sp. SIO3E6]